MRAYQDRRIPVEAFIVFIRTRLGLNGNHLTGDYVNACQVPFLPLDINDVRVSRLGGSPVAIPIQDHMPI